MEFDARTTLQTNDGAIILVTYRGLRRGPPEVIAKLARNELVDPSEYYFRIAPVFETAEKKYQRLNQIVAIGVGDRRPSGPAYDIDEIL